jgi:shikimate dehydrogenase
MPGFYVPMDIAHGDLEDALSTLPKLGFVGLNVTIPHKETVLGLADRVSDRASLIGAANTLSFQNGMVHADNTDGHGFLENLKQGAPDWKASSGPATVLGAGGAARAVISALVGAGIAEIRLANRTRSRSEALRTEFGSKLTVFDWVQAGNAIDGASLVVNTTSLGMVGKQEFRVPLDALTPDMVVNDLVYTPLETSLLAEAKAVGCTTVDGLGMLLHQAAPGFERWFNYKPDIDDATRKAVLGL